MSNQADTRLFAGSILQVDDLSSGWIETGEIRTATGFGAPSTENDVTTAASEIEDESRLGLPDQGDATITMFLNMDDEFQQAMETMRNGGETRTFRLLLPEGTLNCNTFDAFVLDGQITGQSNNVYEYTLVISIVSQQVWSSV